ITQHVRRSLMLSGAVFVTACARGATSGSTSSPTPRSGSRELTPEQQARHALNRLGFGPRPGDVAHVAAMGVDRWIDTQLRSAAPDTFAERVLASLETQRKQVFELIADNPEPGEVIQGIGRRRAAAGIMQQASATGPAAYTPAESELLRRAQVTAQQLGGQITAARLLRAVASERQLQEVMTDFWENHFSVFVGKSPNRFSIVEYDRDVIRPRALGKFRDLLGAVAKSPQMLFYLDNWQSGVDALHPNIDEERIEARRVANTSDP